MIHYFYHLDYPRGPSDDSLPTSKSNPLFPPAAQPVTAPPAAATSTGQLNQHTAVDPRQLAINNRINDLRRGQLVRGQGPSIRPEATPKAKSPAPAALDVDPADLVIHVRLYAVAEKYEIKGLKSLALRKFRVTADNAWDTKEFLAAAAEAYTSTVEQDRGLRDVVIETIHNHRSLLDKPSAQAVFKQLNISWDLLMYQRKMGSY